MQRNRKFNFIYNFNSGISRKSLRLVLSLFIVKNNFNSQIQTIQLFNRLFIFRDLTMFYKADIRFLNLKQKF